MKNIITVTNQSELDALPDIIEDCTCIEIRSNPDEFINIYKQFGSIPIKVRGSSRVCATNSVYVHATDSSYIDACVSAHILVDRSATVYTHDYAQVDGYGWSQIIAYGSPRVKAYGACQVMAFEQSKVEAFENVGVHVYSSEASIELSGMSVAWMHESAEVKIRSISAKTFLCGGFAGVTEWLAYWGITPNQRGNVVLFKRVDSDFKTQANTQFEIIWQIGLTITEPVIPPADRIPNELQCVKAKRAEAIRRPEECCISELYAWATPELYFGSRCIAIEVNEDDLYLEQCHPRVIAFRSGKVVYECTQ